MPSSSIRCNLQARASALTSVPSGCGLELGTKALPSGADDALAATAALKSHGMRTISVLLGAVDNAVIFVGC